MTPQQLLMHLIEHLRALEALEPPALSEDVRNEISTARAAWEEGK